MTTTTPRALTFGITGMTCGSCQRQVESALAGVAGVQEARVNLARGTADVRFDPSIATPAALAEAVRRAGYGIGMPAPGSARRSGGGCACGCG
jgi:P-type Cu+ transporter